MKIAITYDVKEERKHLRTLIFDAFGRLRLPASSVTESNSGEALLTVSKTDNFDFIEPCTYMYKPSKYENTRRIRRTDNDIKLIFCIISNGSTPKLYKGNTCYYLCKAFKAKSFENTLTQINLTEYIEHQIPILPQDSKILIIQKLHEELYDQFNYLYCCNKVIIFRLYDIKSIYITIFILKYYANIPISCRKLCAYTNFSFDPTRKEVF